MLRKNEIAGRLHRRLLEESRRFSVEDVRIGASYVAVVLTGGRIGLAARLKEVAGTEIEAPRFGTICGRRAETLLDRILFPAQAPSSEPWGSPRPMP